MSKSSRQGMCNSELPRFLVGSEGGESRELDDIDMRKISEHYREEEEEEEEDDDDEDQSERQIMVGICSMMKKSKSKPMTEILERLCKFEYITVVIFPEEVILGEPVEKWPLGDCLISFPSKGFPLDKAVSYAKLRNPLLINDLNMQYFIQDRREVYRILQEEGIDLPRYAVLNRDPDRPEEGVVCLCSPPRVLSFRYGHFSGINRKVQLTYLPNGQPKASSEEEDALKEGPSLLLVLKWGGELTPAGRVQAEELGRAFRCMYPGGQGDYAGFPGCGLLRLHSTYRHDLKIYASDEGRVQMTAAAFAKVCWDLSAGYVDLQLYHSETLELMLQRWSKLERDFRMKNGRYDISKIPDIYDCVKYDTQHNSSLGLEDTLELFRLSRALADIIIPQEYGITKAEKLDIASAYCLPLVKKIQLDLQRTHEDEAVNKLHPLYSRGVMSPGRHVRTRLYFTSESHVHSLLNIFRYGGLLDEQKDEQWKQAMDYLSAVSELNYMTQIVIMLYEDNNKDPSSEERFHVELHFSPGVKGCKDEDNAPMGFGFRPASSENHEKQTNPGSLEDLSQDEPDRAALTEPISIQRKSPLIRGRKAGSMEALSESNTSSRGLAYRIFPSSSRQSPEIKPSGLGAQCAGLFSASFPNLRDLSRVPRKKPSSLRNRSSQTELLSMPAVKRFSVSYARHPTNALLNEHQVVKLLAGLHHLHRCSYHLRLLLAGQKPPECLSGQHSCYLLSPSPASCLTTSFLIYTCKVCDASAYAQVLQLSALLFYLTSCFSSFFTQWPFFLLYNIS
ncbi:inositol hexakisphosphate and diphosphoinositol-pentakisphosphate kinase 1-like [Sinocyclocheilus grahami]|uniref:inositol hexakisphosphate and diphosphoinositol-pentakisphosphate kinase 1-like n=1 Tax=Sinocyclocheilus grahami TaxID=75366 RepID=UPI0007ACE93D|nr:PREDICTED: inositol hexakisphosphate and diphosphoinositol-pentakisphosphate kinase 1-like [Sinocyclocheilus grahami]